MFGQVRGILSLPEAKLSMALLGSSTDDSGGSNLTLYPLSFILPTLDCPKQEGHVS